MDMADLRALAPRLGNRQLDLLRIKWLQGKIAAVAGWRAGWAAAGKRCLVQLSRCHARRGHPT
jgi:hypothetical protein